ncbi:unnamed protein product [Orchesella dallaii]|uniref:Uncharacterized protein n=1 Tax=Orchesella dallaii TaxID=48710 RepID=A0ABP1R1G5_9HEXA
MKSLLLIFSTLCLSILILDSYGKTLDNPPPPKVPTAVNQTQPKLNAYQDSSKKNSISAAYPESRVTITVGEDNGFHYTVNGVTNSQERIAVSGEYYNDEYHGDGYVRLFLVAEPRLVYYETRPVGNRLDFRVQNYYYEWFYFEIYTPAPVTGYDLRHGQINSTAILVTGPSRSAVHGRSAVKTTKKP